MAVLTVENVAIVGMSAAVPKTIDKISDIYKWENPDQFSDATGIRSRRRVDSQTTSSDLCVASAKVLMEELGWTKDDVECLLFVTQTPDYHLPATSCIIQDKLGLPTSCYTLDISLGCSGWVYALSVISALMQSGSMKKGLLLAGETPTKICSPDDKSSFALFGDAGTATALEYQEGTAGFRFLMNSDGKGFETIIVRDGGYRNPTTEDSLKAKEKEEEVIRNRLQLELDGLNVFSFGITKVPKSIKSLCAEFDIDLEDVDLFTFHQANLKMNEMIRKKLKLPAEKVPNSLECFGNTSSASIPLTLVSREAERLRNDSLYHIACGFGVGLSWASVCFPTDRIIVPELVEI